MFQVVTKSNILLARCSKVHRLRKRKSTTSFLSPSLQRPGKLALLATNNLVSQSPLPGEQKFASSTTTKSGPYGQSDRLYDTASIGNGPRGLNAKPEAEHSLVKALSDEWREKLTSKSTARKFNLAQVLKNIQFLANKEFPMPESLTYEQWDTMVSFKSKKARVYYLDAILEGKDKDEATMKGIRDEDDMTFMPLTVDQEVLDRVIGNDPVARQNWEAAQYEFEQLLMDGNVEYCSTPTEKELVELLSYTNASRRRRMIMMITQKRLFKLKNHINKRASKVKNDRFYEERKRAAKSGDSHIEYGLGANTMFFRIIDATMDKFDAWRAISAFNEWGRPLCIDMSHIRAMDMVQRKSLINRELMFALKHNRQSWEPFAVHLTGYSKDQDVDNLLEQVYPGAYDSVSQVSVTEKSYLDLFPRENLVYLTPDSSNDLVYNPADIYVIGGIVDTTHDVSRIKTLAIAKRQKIRHARLPMRSMIGLSATLNIDHVLPIVNDFCRTRDWFYSMRWVPPRFFRSRLNPHSYTKDNERIYKAHFATAPGSFMTYSGMLTPRQYRKQYKKVFEESLETLQGPEAYERKVRREDREHERSITSILPMD